MALTCWPRTSITARSVCRKAWRAAASCERPHRAGDGLEIDALAAAARSHALAGALDRLADPAIGHEPDPGGRAREGRAAEHRAHLVTEAAAGDQRQPLDPLGELVEELHRDPAAEGVADDGGAVDADRRQQVADAARVGAERVVASHRGRIAVAEQVRGDDGVAVGEAQCHALPVPGGVDHPVDQHHRRPVPGDPVDHPVAVELDLPLVEDQGRHGGDSTASPHVRAS